MEVFRKQPPPYVFRGATLIGCVALLLGVAGIFYYGDRERTWRDALPADVCTVFVRGVQIPDGEALVVEVNWQDAEGGTGSEIGALGAEAGMWSFHQAPEGEPLTLRVYLRGQEGRRLLHEQHAIFTLGAGFEVSVRAK